MRQREVEELFTSRSKVRLPKELTACPDPHPFYTCHDSVQREIKVWAAHVFQDSNLESWPCNGKAVEIRS